MSCDQPLVTALINAYNYGRYLAFAINSVLVQTYKNIEIIVVDDGSTDHTREVLAQYGEKITVVRTENGGQGHTFNVGIPRARGELLMLLDADDVWLPNKVQRMVELAAQYPTAVMLYHQFTNVDKYGREIGSPQPATLTNGDYRAKYLRSGGSWWSPITSVLVLRPAHIKQVLPMPTYAHREGADTLITDFCAVTGEIATLQASLTLRRLHGSNLYAAGRDDRTFRTEETRKSDVRRIEWRMHSLRQVLERTGRKFEVNLNRNEWRVTNLYWLGRASFWAMLWASLLCPEHSLKSRWQRLKWAVTSKKMYRQD
jgi:glycosyltransferase involved in cell wall biosynthesis